MSGVPDFVRQVHADAGLRRAVLFGTTGTGKSTELWRAFQALEETQRVVYLDLHAHFSVRVGDLNGLEAIEPWELLFLVSLSVLKAAERFGYRDLRDTYEKEIAVETQAIVGGNTSLSLGKLVSSMASTSAGAVAALGATLLTASPTAGIASAVATAGVVRLAVKDILDPVSEWAFPVGTPNSPKLPDQDPKLAALARTVNDLLAALTFAERRPLLVIDGLDTVSPAAASRLFVKSGLIGRIDSHVLCTAPLSFRQSGDAWQIKNLDTLWVAEVPVLDPASRPSEVGLAFFREVYRRRASDLGTSLSASQIDTLAYNSGGRVRDFIRFVRDLAMQMLVANAIQVSDEMLSGVLDHFRKTFVEAGLNADEIDVLRALLADPEKKRPAHPATTELLRTFRILPYMNGSEWYHPHPLLLRGRLRPAGG